MNKTELEKTWSPTRVALLLRNHLLDEAPLAAIGLGIFGGLGLLNLFMRHSADLSIGGSAIWPTAILLLGFLVAGRSFQAMHGNGSTDWLLLPATGGEKYLATLIAVVVAWPLVAALACVALSALLAGLALLAGWQTGPVWLPFNDQTLSNLGFYLSMAPVLVAGSTFFRKQALLRTLGTLVGTTTVLVILGALVIGLLGGGGVHRGGISIRNFNIEMPDSLDRQRVLRILGDLWRFVILPGSALAFGWFRVAEKEARDAVQ